MLLFIAWSVITQSETVGALAQLGGLQDRWLAQRARAIPPEAAAAARRLWDRACFTLGVVNVAGTMYALGAAPAKFYLLHTPKAVLLIGARWLAFLSERPPRHLLLLDFCYCVNALGLLYVWAWPGDARLFQIFFVSANGPVAWSVLAFNQALVSHSWQHITSVFVHVSPMLLSYCIRWHAAHEFAVCGDDWPRCAAPAPAALVWAAFSRFYAYWLVLYCVFVFIVLGRYIHERGFQTLFDRVSAHGPLAPLLQRLTREGESELKLVKKAAYIVVHGIVGVVTMSLAAWLLWSEQAAHAAFIVAMCAASTWNASSFYFVDLRVHDTKPAAASAENAGASNAVRETAASAPDGVAAARRAEVPAEARGALRRRGDSTAR